MVAKLKYTPLKKKKELGSKITNRLLESKIAHGPLGSKITNWPPGSKITNRLQESKITNQPLEFKLQFFFTLFFFNGKRISIHHSFESQHSSCQFFWLTHYMKVFQRRKQRGNNHKDCSCCERNHRRQTDIVKYTNLYIFITMFKNFFFQYFPVLKKTTRNENKN